MNTKTKFAMLIYSMNIVGMSLTGLVYIFSDKFMSYHSEIIQTNWSALDRLEQLLYLGMMRTEGAGFLATALAMAVLLLIPFREGKVWSYWAIPVIGIVEYLPTFFATLHISMVTNASPPWPVVIFAIILLMLGLFLTICDCIFGTEK